MPVEEMEEKLLAKEGKATSGRERMLVVVLEQGARGLLHVVQFSVSYCIMLLFMYSNGKHLPMLEIELEADELQGILSFRFFSGLWLGLRFSRGILCIRRIMGEFSSRLLGSLANNSVSDGELKEKDCC